MIALRHVLSCIDDDNMFSSNIYRNVDKNVWHIGRHFDWHRSKMLSWLWNCFL